MSHNVLYKLFEELLKPAKMMGEDGEYIEDENRSDKLLILKNNPEPELEPKPKTVTLKRKENENYGFAHTGTEINGKVFISEVSLNSIASDQKIPEGSQITKINDISLTPKTTGTELKEYINKFPYQVKLEYIYNKAEYEEFNKLPERLAQLSQGSTRPSYRESVV